MGNQAFQSSYEDIFIDNYEFIKSDGFVHQHVDVNNNNSRLTQSLNNTPVRPTLKTQSVGFSKRQTRSETLHGDELVADHFNSKRVQSVNLFF